MVNFQVAVFPKIYDGSSSIFLEVLYSPLYTGRVSKATALHKIDFGRLSLKHFNFYRPRQLVQVQCAGVPLIGQRQVER